MAKIKKRVKKALKALNDEDVKQGMVLTYLNTSNTFRALWRTKWLCLIVSAIGVFYYLVAPPNSTIKLVAYKLFIGLCALIVSHIGVKSLFDYISLSQLFAKDEVNEVPDSIKFLGACILRATIMSAFVIGVLLGI
jgi:predicted ferric reductase